MTRPSAPNAKIASDKEQTTIVTRRLCRFLAAKTAFAGPSVCVFRVGGDSNARRPNSAARSDVFAARFRAESLSARGFSFGVFFSSRDPANAHRSPPCFTARDMSAGGNANSSADEQTCSKRSALDAYEFENEKSVFLCVAAYDRNGAAQKSAACVCTSTSRRIKRSASLLGVSTSSFLASVASCVELVNVERLVFESFFSL